MSLQHWTLIFCVPLWLGASGAFTTEAVAELCDGADTGAKKAREIRDWCRTETEPDSNESGYRDGAGLWCHQHGMCDDPANRDTWLYESQDSTVWLRAIIHVFCNGDGSICWSDSETVNLQIATLNSCFEQAGVQFACEWRFVYSEEFYSLANAEVTDMLYQYAIAPDSQVNIYVVDFEPGGSSGTYPWRPQALSPLGGIIMDSWQFTGARETLVHEMGHCLGLWHTHRGVSEVPLCSDCYEAAGCSEMVGNLTGDFCADTPPTPVNLQCGPPGGTDYCSGLPWGPTQPENFMSYSGSECQYLFTPQQAARMRCWIADALITWTTTDADGDGIANQDDNCPAVANPMQDDSDGDTVGDACDNCPYQANSSQEDTDSDGIGDSCDLCTDIDSDGFGDIGLPGDTCGLDNCPDLFNPMQEDSDGDLIGDSCDNCIYVMNADQSDSDYDGIGDACEWICGDCDASSEVDIDDVVYLINYIFSGGSEPDPYESGDADCSGGVDIDDVVYLISFIFSGGSTPCDSDGDGVPNC